MPPPSLSATQFQIKNNMDEYRSFVQDLSSWQKEMKEKDISIAKATPPATSRKVPPIRGTRTIDVDAKPEPNFLPQQPAEPSAPAKPNGLSRIKSADYRAWDKFDVEKAIEELDTESAFGKQGAQQIREQYDYAEQTKKASGEEDRLEKALLEKEQGNAYFKRANYPKAISHYGKSMALDPRNPVLPINRAMAYLKMKKWAEAEEDCIRGLSLDPKNVKALWRRGIARKEQGKIEMARKDWEKALVFDPSNKSIKEELDKLLQPSTPVSPRVPQSMRIPIEEVETDEEAADTKDEENRRKQVRQQKSAPKKPEVISPMVEMTPVKTTLTPSANVAGTASTSAAISEKGPVPTKGVSDVEERKLQETPSNPSSLLAAKDNTASPACATKATSSDSSKTASSTSWVTAAKAIVYTPPTTSFEFDRDWKTYKRDDSMLFEYLQCIPPSTFPNIFKSALESDYLAKMVDVMNKFYIGSKPPDDIYSVLKNLCSVKRFDMTLMFLSSGERKALETLFGHLLSCLGSEAFSVSKSDLEALAKQYKVSI